MLSPTTARRLIRTCGRVVLLLLLGTTTTVVQSHLFFQEPAARTCFYGGYWGLDPDGPWRRAPCDRTPGPPTATWVAGSSTCLTLHEFVPHPATYDIALAYEPVGPGDMTAEWVNLVRELPDPAPSDQTGYQRFLINVPANKTCDACTIQVRQYAADLDWYYYACADVKIVLLGEDDTAAEVTTTKECVWTPGPSRIRAKILTSIVVGSVVLFDALLTIAWFLWVCRSRRKKGGKNTRSSQDGKGRQTTSISYEEVETPNVGESNEDDVGEKITFCEAAKRPLAKRVGCGILIFALVSGLTAGLVIGGLRACW